MTSRKTAPALAIIIVAVVAALEFAAWIAWYRVHGLSGSALILGVFVATSAIFIALRGVQVNGHPAPSRTRLGASVFIASLVAGIALIWAFNRFGT